MEGPVAMSLGPHRPCKPRLLVFSKSLLGWMALVLGFSFCLNCNACLGPGQGRDEEGREEGRRSGDSAKPEDIDLTTDDGLEMKATYYPGTKGQESIPVIFCTGSTKGANTAARTSRRSRGWPRSCRRSSVAPSSCPTSAATATAPRSRWQQQAHGRSQGQEADAGAKSRRW